jgi:hypothetical protein
LLALEGGSSLKSPAKLGFGLKASATGAGSYDIAGFWAVTAP